MLDCVHRARKEARDAAPARSARQGDELDVGKRGCQAGDEFSHSRVVGSGNKWDELYSQAERKQGKTDRNQDDIEFEKNVHEMRFAPEIHEINYKGSKNPIAF